MPNIDFIPLWEPPKDNKKIAVIIATFNRPVFLSKAIASVMSQTCKDYHLYIVDNNSVPRVKEFLKQYIGRPNISIYTTNTTSDIRLYYFWGYVLANFALSQGNEDYVVFLDDDCTMRPKKLEVMSKYLDTHPDHQIVWGTQQIREGQKLVMTRLADKVHFKAACQIDGNQIMFRRSLIYRAYPETRMFTTRRCDGVPDANFFTRLSILNVGIHPIKEVTDEMSAHPKQTMKLWQKIDVERDDVLRE